MALLCEVSFEPLGIKINQYHMLSMEGDFSFRFMIMSTMVMTMKTMMIMMMILMIMMMPMVMMMITMMMMMVMMTLTSHLL